MRVCIVLLPRHQIGVYRVDFLSMARRSQEKPGNLPWFYGSFAVPCPGTSISDRFPFQPTRKQKLKQKEGEVTAAGQIA